MKTITEIRDWLLENAVSEFGNLMLDGLDFGDFDGDVFISEMIVKKDLVQSNQLVKGGLYQERQTVGHNLHQSFQTVGGDLYQSFQNVGGYLNQSYQNVGGDLNQSNHEVSGNYRSVNINVTGIITFEEPKKLLKEVTLEELAELGYKLKGDNNAR